MQAEYIRDKSHSTVIPSQFLFFRNFVAKVLELKSTLAIFLLAALSAPALLVITYLRVEEQALEATVKERSREGGELTRLAITKTESHMLRWEHSREFEYRGQMYDIIHSYQQGDTTFYECWADHEETRLKKEMQRLLVQENANTPLHNERDRRLFDFLKSLIVPTPGVSSYRINPSITGVTDQYSLFYKSQFTPPSKPPPR